MCLLATVFLPLTFVTGFFGQNFSWLVGHIADGTASSPMGGLLLPLALLFLWLRLRAPSRTHRRRS